MTLQDFLAQAYVQRALLVSVLVALCAAMLGVSLVLRRFSLIGDGLSHVAFGSMAVAAVLGVTEIYVSMPVTIGSAILLLRGNSKAKLKGDAAIALVSVSSLAIAYLLFSKFSTGNVSSDVCKTLFGSSSIMTLSDMDVIVSIVMAVLVLLFFVFFYQKIFAITFDESFARATGTRTAVYNTLMAAITGIVIVLAMKMVGALLITALIVFPVLAAMRLFSSFHSVMLSSALIAVVGAFSGVIASLMIPGLPVGSTIVAADLIFFLLSLFVRLVVRFVRSIFKPSSVAINKK